MVVQLLRAEGARVGVWGVEKSSNSKKRRLGSEVKRDKSSLNNRVSSQFGRRLVRGRERGRREGGEREMK